MRMKKNGGLRPDTGVTYIEEIVMILHEPRITRAGMYGKCWIEDIQEYKAFVSPIVIHPIQILFLYTTRTGNNPARK